MPVETEREKRLLESGGSGAGVGRPGDGDDRRRRRGFGGGGSAQVARVKSGWVGRPREEDGGGRGLTGMG